jgi:hypothetical protein
MGLSFYFLNLIFLGYFLLRGEMVFFLCLRINKGYAHHASTFSLFLRYQANIIDFNLHHVPP